jgi:hypothetical protein
LELIEVKQLDKNVIQVRYRVKSKNLSWALTKDPVSV